VLPVRIEPYDEGPRGLRTRGLDTGAVSAVATVLENTDAAPILAKDVAAVIRTPVIYHNDLGSWNRLQQAINHVAYPAGFIEARNDDREIIDGETALFRIRASHVGHHIPFICRANWQSNEHPALVLYIRIPTVSTSSGPAKPEARQWPD